MAVYVTTKEGTTASQLFAKIKKAIEAGDIATWSFEEKTGFYHTTTNEQWNQGAYLSPTLFKQRLTLTYQHAPGTASSIKAHTYGVLNGRFIEMLMNHFINMIEHISVKDTRPKK